LNANAPPITAKTAMAERTIFAFCIGKNAFSEKAKSGLLSRLLFSDGFQLPHLY
jgi:hypothetical protein